MDAIETRQIEADGRTYRISIFYDEDAANPLATGCEMGTILSLNRKHRNFEPDAITAATRSNPDAVKLGYFEHGRCLWSVAGERQAAARCRWDCVPFAGVWLPDAETLASAARYSGRTRQLFLRKRAREACDAYSQWCNGEVYGYEVARVGICPCCGEENAEAIESCRGFFGLEACQTEARASVAAQAGLAA